MVINDPLMRAYFLGWWHWGGILRFPLKKCNPSWHFGWLFGGPFRCQVSDEQAMRRENQHLKELRHEEIRFQSLCNIL